MREFVIPEEELASLQDNEWTAVAEEAMIRYYMQYSRARALKKLAKLLNKEFGRNWTSNALGKKAARMGLI